MTERVTPKRRGKRLLVASIGLATLSYVGAPGCGDDDLEGSGNLLVPPTHDAGPDAAMDAGDPGMPTGNLLPPPLLQDSGNLLAPPPTDASTDSAIPASGNLLAPPDLDASQ
jgi:hypothetical protein